jgi:hypothetical protein
MRMRIKWRVISLKNGVYVPFFQLIIPTKALFLLQLPGMEV